MYMNPWASNSFGHDRVGSCVTGSVFVALLAIITTTKSPDNL